MEFLIFWLIFAFACFMLAKKKNRNEWLAAFMGFVFGIFALIYYLVVDKVPDETSGTN